MDTATGEMLDDTVEWARFTNIAWKGDSSGFYYSRFPEPEAGASFNAGIDAHAVYFHQLGTPQSEDRLVHAPLPGQPLLNTVDVTPDGRYLIVYTSAAVLGLVLIMLRGFALWIAVLAIALVGLVWKSIASKR